MTPNKANDENSPRTPVGTPKAQQPMRVTTHQIPSSKLQPGYKPLGSVGTPLRVIQSTASPEIVPLLKNIQQTSINVDAKLTAQSQQVAEFSHRLTNVEQNLRVLQTTGVNVEIEKPDSVPFKTWADILKYDKRSEEDAAKMIKWMVFHNQYSSPKANARIILQHNYLLTENLLTKITWSGSKGKKTSKKPIFRRRLFHDFRRALVKMYPTMTNYEYRRAIQKALRAANTRVQQRNKNKNNYQRDASEDLDDYFNQDWTPDDIELDNEDHQNTGTDSDETGDLVANGEGRGDAD